MKNKFSTLNSPFSIQKGFTLIELIVVISIIGVLSSLLVANFMNVRYKTRDGVRKKDLEQIRLALETYRIDVGIYPEVLYSVDCPTSASLQDNSTLYMEKIPCDPLLNENYDYVQTSDFRYNLSACIENENDQDQNLIDDEACESGKRFMLKNP